jgi:hypothetical protein
MNLLGGFIGARWLAVEGYTEAAQVAQAEGQEVGAGCAGDGDLPH